MAIRLTKNIERPECVTLSINNIVVSAYAGETIATVLFVENINVFYLTRSNRPRAPFCNMGTCFECQVRVKRKRTDNLPEWVLACMTPIEEGMMITTGEQIHNMEFGHDKD